MEQPLIPVRVVVCAANRFEGIIALGARHFDSLMVSQITSFSEHHCLPLYPKWEQGFVDQWGVFMDRYEALQVAKDAGQINKDEAVYAKMIVSVPLVCLQMLLTILLGSMLVATTDSSGRICKQCFPVMFENMLGLTSIQRGKLQT